MAADSDWDSQKRPKNPPTHLHSKVPTPWVLIVAHFPNFELTRCFVYQVDIAHVTSEKAFDCIRYGFLVEYQKKTPKKVPKIINWSSF